MTGMVRARYMLDFKQEAVRLAPGGQSLSSVARGLGVSAQSIDNWVKADAVGGLKEAKGKPVNADQMEIARLKAELVKTRMERDILNDRRWTAARLCAVETPVTLAGGGELPMAYRWRLTPWHMGR